MTVTSRNMNVSPSGLDRSLTTFTTEKTKSTIKDQKSLQLIKNNLQMVIQRGIYEQLNDRSISRAMSKTKERETSSAMSMNATAALKMKRHSYNPLDADLQIDAMNLTQGLKSQMPLKDYEDMKKMQSQQNSRFAIKRASTNARPLGGTQTKFRTLDRNNDRLTPCTTFLKTPLPTDGRSKGQPNPLD